ncbi:arabinofuranosidase catalytic domain-containing protein [Rurimicrobium arvi]|uniref:Alpha-L-arabinofuranosidase B catalytic domain-containing protein n=1 Tax=Rurimicrobium arvi TaxID=2049916 RepID=A0ABP8N3T3_9BACT
MKHSPVLLILFTASVVFKNNSFGQGPQQMFWALNKCPLILAQIGTSASGAYSLRKLNCNYTGKAIKIRRGTTTTGTTTLDIGFTSTGDLDTSAIKTFIGTTNGAYIDTWYDQSGNGKHLTQTTRANQPRIASNSGVIDRVNSLPTITFQDVSDEMYAPAMDIQSFNAVRRASSSTSSTTMQYLVSVPADYDFSIRSSSSTAYTYGDFNGDDFWNTGGLYINNISTYTYTSALHNLYSYTGSVRTASTFSLSSTFLSRGMFGGDPVSELIVFPTPLAAGERTTMYLDQKAYYSLP